MIIDVAAEPVEPSARYDVCVIGSGPAGTTVAAELARRSPARVCVLESGTFESDDRADALRSVESDGLRIKPWSRERVVGGASTTWAGLSSPLDDLDFSAPGSIEAPGWPIGRRDLEQYYLRASEAYGFAPADEFFAASCPTIEALREQSSFRIEWRALDEKPFLATDPPFRFGSLARSIFDGSTSVDLLVNATTIALEGDDPGRAARCVATTVDGERFSLEAGCFVVATGGIENARLLLNSRSPWAAGLGNGHDQLGRCFMNHPKANVGSIRLRPDLRGVRLPHLFGGLRQGLVGYAGLTLPGSLRAQEGLLNSYVRFEPLFPWSDSPGIDAAVALAKRGGRLIDWWKRRASRDEVLDMASYAETGDDTELLSARTTPAFVVRELREVVRDPGPVTRYALARLRPSNPLPVTGIRLRNFLAMEPTASNRVTLGSRRDAFGMPVAHVRHEVSDLATESIAAVHRALADEVARLGLGVVSSPLLDGRPLPPWEDASHHLGATRMGSSPTSSVVDINARVHEVHNVFVAGSSVFPRGGCANPTYTLVALAIRLADHLRTVEPWRDGTGATATDTRMQS